MESGAIDLHKKESQIRLVSTVTGEIVEKRIQTRRDRFTAVFLGRPRMRILLEASMESAWVAQHLETLGHEVIVADPNYAPMCAHRSRRVKTDRRDVAALAEACRLEVYRPAHRRSQEQMTVQWRLVVREQLVRTRTRAISLMRTMARAAGCRIGTGAAETFLTRLEAIEIPTDVRMAMAPLRTTVELLNAQIASADRDIERAAAENAVAQRLMTLPAIGPVTASAYVAALDDVRRCRRLGQVTSYLGLVAREHEASRIRAVRPPKVTADGTAVVTL